jgi:hypothetical protein
MSETKAEKNRLVMLRSDVLLYSIGDVPRPATLASAPILGRWHVVIVESKSASGREMRLRGTLSDHASIADGQVVQTARVVWMDRNCRFARTVNTLYRLGERE